MEIRDEHGNVLGDSTTFQLDIKKYYLNLVLEYEQTGGKAVEWIDGLDALNSADTSGASYCYGVAIAYTDEQLAEMAAREEREAAQAAANTANTLSDSAALALAQKLSTATTLSQVRSFAKQVAQEYEENN